MASYSKLLFEKYFQENSLVRSNIESFNDFVEKMLQRVVDESKIIEPTIIPPNVESFKIRFDKIIIGKPEITEADGSKRPIYPVEARLRKISYAAPVYLEVSSHINDVQRESIQTQIGSLPVMLKSNLCHLHKMNRDELMEKGEDPDDPGGYFIINGTERVLVNVEDLAANQFTVEHDGGTSEYVGKIYSEFAAFRVPHTVERLKDGVFYLSFTRAKRVPIIMLIKALGLVKDEDIMNAVSKDRQFDEILINLFEHANIKNVEDAVDNVAKKIGITQAKDVRIERMDELLDKYLLPHLGITKDARIAKARNLCKMLRKFMIVANKEIGQDDKDHYGNKRLKLAGDLLTDLFRVNLKVLIGDLLYNFQRLVKRGKFPSIKVIIREKLLTSRIYSAMATGNWVGSRKGISQRMQRINHLDKMSHLQRVVSPLSSSQENFAARELHATHLGRLCPCETPEGTNIGLRKNLALLAQVSREADEHDVLHALKNAGMREVN